MLRQELEKLGTLPRVDSGFLENLVTRRPDDATNPYGAHTPKRDRRTLGDARGKKNFKEFQPWYQGLSAEEKRAFDKQESEIHPDQTWADRIHHVSRAANLASGLTLEKEAADKDVTAWQLAYQWAHGRGPSQRHFDENSVMGREMMQTDYVTSAAQDAVKNMLHLKRPASGKEDRSLGKDKGTVAEILYPLSFIYDVTLGNHTRGLHGSMKVRAEAGMPFQRNGKTYVPLRVTGTDDLSALSGTRLPPSLGGYEKEKGGSLFSKNNPFGLEGPFRTIQASYDLHFSVEVDPRMTVSGAWKIDPSKILPGRPPSS